MKTKIIIEIETNPKFSLLPEEGTTPEDYTKEELEKCNNDYKELLHNEVVKFLDIYLDSDAVLESIFDNLEESFIENMEEPINYGLKFKICNHLPIKEKDHLEDAAKEIVKKLPDLKDILPPNTKVEEKYCNLPKIIECVDCYKQLEEYDCFQCVEISKDHDNAIWDDSRKSWVCLKCAKKLSYLKGEIKSITPRKKINFGVKEIKVKFKLAGAK